jgi:ribosome-associated translation inhibitor RaiA
MERARGREEFKFSLRLSLPAATLNATAAAPGIGPAVRVAFAEIETQLKKHTALLRHDYEWKRKRRLRDAAVA